MKRRLVLPLAVLALASCGGAPSLAEIPETCGLSPNSWMPDDEGVTVVTYGAAPSTMDAVDCVLEESGASQELTNTIHVNAGPYGGIHKVEEERGLRYSWQWKSETDLHLMVTPT